MSFIKIGESETFLLFMFECFFSRKMKTKGEYNVLNGFDLMYCASITFKPFS